MNGQSMGTHRPGAGRQSGRIGPAGPKCHEKTRYLGFANLAQHDAVNGVFKSAGLDRFSRQ